MPMAAASTPEQLPIRVIQRHLETFSFGTASKIVAMTATLSDISATFGATSETFCDTAPMEDGLIAERAERGMGKS